MLNAASPPPIGVLVAPGKVYREAATAIETALKAKGFPCIFVELPGTPEGTPSDAQPSAPSPPPVTSSPAIGATAAGSHVEVDGALARLAEAGPVVVVTCGGTATLLALEKLPKTPVVFCTVPNALDMPFLAADSPDRKRVYGTTTDVAPQEQVEFMRQLCPGLKNVGVLYSARSRRTMEAIASAAASRGFEVVEIEANRDEFPRAIDTLHTRGCGAVLMLPDAAVYNAPNVQRLLLWGVRQKKPVLAFSANIVKAGALAGQFADTQALVNQTAELVERVVDGTDASTAGLHYPRHVQTAINERTAEMIGVVVAPKILDAATFRFGRGP